MSAVTLHAEGLNKRFGATTALTDARLTLRAGEIHALMGQNGAGKSTLIKLITGVEAPDAGRISLDGRDIAPATPLDAQREGISTVYQEVNLCPNLSVAENLYAGRYPRGRLGLIDHARMREGARALMAELNLDLDVQRSLGSYPVAIQQMVAIARALGVSARVLILDEPTSSLDRREVQELFAVMRRLRDRGLAILFVSHFLDQIYAVSDRITVLRNGTHVGEFAVADLKPAALVAAMVGREVTTVAAREARDAVAVDAPLVAEACGLGRRGALEPLDLGIRTGEVVGLGGLLGSGRTELARLLFGLDRADSGQVRVAGEAVDLRHPADAVRHGFALCPEERKTDGIIAGLSVRENIALALQARGSWWRALPRSRQQELAREFIDLLGIKVSDAETPVGALSGGNQQKVVLARWLATAPRLLILDEPTRGIDVAARQEIMVEMLRLARQGMAVLFISAELEELTRLCDRVAVLRDRRKVGELPAECKNSQLMEMIAGAAPDS
ncbi:MAG TPA: sugar ABC transporter ATP-binding protein [Steroidobacteraceae bacterium]|nr:sugar ABC transporter ATP-binding protein [Steroidobacteraceae bacterium]